MTMCGNQARQSLKVLIVDDLPQVREGLAIVLGLAGPMDEPGIEIAGKAENGVEAVRLARELHPDVILMDLEMPELDGLAAARRVKLMAPDIRIIALTIHGDPETRQKARQAGVDAFVEKGAPIEELIRAIRNLPLFLDSGIL